MNTRYAVSFILISLFLLATMLTVSSRAKEMAEYQEIKIRDFSSHPFPSLHIRLPKGVVVEKADEMEDFEVHYFSFPEKEGEVQTTLGIYIGFHPSLFSVKVKGAKRDRQGEIGNQPVEWIRWEERVESQVIHHRETLIKGLFLNQFPKDSFEKKVVLHFFISSPNQKMVQRLQRACEDLQIGKR